MDLKTILAALPADMREAAAKMLQQKSPARDMLILAPWPLSQHGAPALWTRGARRRGSLQMPSNELLGSKENPDPVSIRGLLRGTGGKESPGIATWNRDYSCWAPRPGTDAETMEGAVALLAEQHGCELVHCSSIQEAMHLAETGEAPTVEQKLVSPAAAVAAIRKALPSLKG